MAQISKQPAHSLCRAVMRAERACVRATRPGAYVCGIGPKLTTSINGAVARQEMADYDKELVADALLKPLKVGRYQLKHGVALAALTRGRNDPVTEAPREINKHYYCQRTTPGGFLLTEGIAPSWGGRGFIRGTGLWTDAQVQGWKMVTEEVHRKQGVVFAQLWHAGRVTHSSLLPENTLPVAASAVKPQGLVRTSHGKVPYEIPRGLNIEEIPLVIGEFVQASKRAMEAGFDGVQLHGGNGYLLQGFLAKDTNKRTDAYGGSVENRARFVLELIDAVSEAIGPDRVGIKLTQGITFSDLIEEEEDSFAQLAYLGPELESRNIAFVEMASFSYAPYYSFVGLTEPKFKNDVWRHCRKHYKGTIMINGGLSPQKAAEYVEEGTADFASFGILFIANANLPDLLRAGKESNQGGWRSSTWYCQKGDEDEKGYTDWPLVEGVTETVADL